MLELSLTRLVLLNILSANSLSSLGNKYDVRITLRLGLGRIDRLAITSRVFITKAVLVRLV